MSSVPIAPIATTLADPIFVAHHPNSGMVTSWSRPPIVAAVSSCM